MAERNPLHEDVGSPILDETPQSSDGLMAALRNFQHANQIEGAVSYLSVGGGREENVLTHQLAQVAVQGRLDTAGSWSFNGNYLDGFHTSYFAHGGMDYELFNHNLDVRFNTNDLVFAQYPELQTRQRIARFVESPDESIEDSRWITQISVQDHWPIHDQLELTYGVQVDYYGYLRDSVHYSPRIGASYDVAPGVALHGQYFRNVVAPGNITPDSQELRSYVHEIAFVPYGTALNPEMVEGFESGIDLARDDYRVALLYTYQSVEDKIATVDVRNTPVSMQLQTLRPFVIFNASNQQSHGVEAQFEKRISDLLTASATYNVTQTIPIYIVEKGMFSTRQMYFRRGEKSEGYHDVQAGIKADIQQTQTQVAANWKWSSGSPIIFGRRESTGSLSALDVEVYQGLPIALFSQSDLKLLVAIQNVLDHSQDSNANADYYRALQYDMPRTIAGGVLIEF
jgi:outer membrane receptor protein involved in Fe transport